MCMNVPCTRPLLYISATLLSNLCPGDVVYMATSNEDMVEIRILMLCNSQTAPAAMATFIGAFLHVFVNERLGIHTCFGLGKSIFTPIPYI